MINQDTSNTAQAMWIGIGSLFSFLFSIVSAAILSRYLTKADYGTYKQVMYVYTTLLSVFTLGLPLAYSYFLPRVSLSEGKALVNKLNACFVILGLFFTLVLFFLSDTFANILKNPDLSKQIKIFSPAPMFILPTMGLQGVLATYKRTELNAIYVLLSRIFMLLCVAVPVVLYKANVDVAIWGFIISSLISCFVAIYMKDVPFRGVKGVFCKISYAEIFKYSIPLMLAGLLGILINAADQFYVSRFFGQEVFADFANGSLELPFVSMVLSASGTVLLPVFSSMIVNNTEKSTIVDLWRRTAVKATYIIYPLVVFCIFFATEIMIFVYGDLYSTSAIYFRIMLIVNIFTVIQFYPIVLALGKTREFAIVHMIIFAVVWAAEYLGVLLIGTPVAVTVISVLCKIIKIFLVINIVSKAIDIQFWKLFPLRQMLLTFICCIFSGGITYFLLYYINLPLELFKISVGFCIFVFVTYILGKLMKIDFLYAVRPLTNKIFH